MRMNASSGKKRKGVGPDEHTYIDANNAGRLCSRSSAEHRLLVFVQCRLVFSDLTTGQMDFVKVKVFFNSSDPPDQPLRDLKNLNWYIYLNLGIQIYVLVKIQIFFNSNEFKLTRGPGRGVGGGSREKKKL